MRRTLVPRAGVIAAWLALLSCLPALAQSARDPTQPPAAWQQAGPAAAGSPGGSGPAGAPTPGRMSILVVDGRPHLIQGTRLFAVGQMLGQARIERITESEVWLREGGELRKIDNFAGIRRSPSDASASGVSARPANPSASSNARDRR